MFDDSLSATKLFDSVVFLENPSSSTSWSVAPLPPPSNAGGKRAVRTKGTECFQLLLVALLGEGERAVKS